MLKQFVKKVFGLVGVDVKRVTRDPDPLLWLKTLDINCVIDIGANAGLFSEQVRRILPSAPIYAFEPLKECFDALSTRFDGDSHFQAYHCALGARQAEVVMQKNEYTPCSSLLPYTRAHKDEFPHALKEEPETVDLRTLDEMMSAKNVVGEKVLIKIDVQGYELEVFKGGEKTLSLAKAVLTETCFTKLYEGQPLFGDIYDYLVKHGFTYHGSVQQKLSQKTGMVIAQDSLFVR